MKFLSINGIEIYRPDDVYEREVYANVRGDMFEVYKNGVYEEGSDITGILNFHFLSYEKILTDNVSDISSRYLLQFLLKEYDNYAKVEYEYKCNKLSTDDEEFWKKEGSLSRRSLKFLLEKICHFGPSAKSFEQDDEDLDRKLALLFISSEEMVNTYMSSESAHKVFPETSVLTLDSTKYNYLDYSAGRTLELVDDIRQDTIKRGEIFKDNNYLVNSDEHDVLLNDALSKKIGIGYNEVLGVFKDVFEVCRPLEEYGSVYFINRSEFVEGISKTLDISFQQADLIFSGFSISSTDVRTETRAIYKPKQEYRLLRRGMIRFPSETGDHLAFSEALVKEALMQLMHAISFKKLPKEWMDSGTKKSLESISNKAGSWFEKVVKDELESLNYLVISSIKKIRLKNKPVVFIPAEVGEIDLLVYSPANNVFSVVECKMVSHATEPAYFQNDINNFVSSKKSYANKFEKKILWAKENKTLITDYFNEFYGMKIDSNRLGSALVTYYPTIAAEFIESFPCVSISKLILDCNSSNQWPYELLDFD